MSKCSYFIPYLEGRLDHATDENGRLFIDRCGQYFGHLIQFMRTGLVPNWSYVTRAKQELLDECDYFGLEHMGHRIRGETSPYELRPEDRQIKEQERTATILIDVFATDRSALDPMDLQLPLLPTKFKRALVIGTYEDFVCRLDALCGGLVRELEDVHGLAFAGGRVVAALTDGECGDIDIFLVCPKDEGMRLLKIVFAAAQRIHQRRNGADAKLLVTRSKHAVTIFSHPISLPPVQIILNVYQSTSSLLNDFDVDCCCCAHVPAEKRVVCTPRGLRALRYGVNIADSDFDGLGYHRRLTKYDCRGFLIAVPGFEPKRLSHEITEGNYVMLEPCDLLLKTEPTTIDDLTLTLRTPGDSIERCLKPSAAQKCVSIRGFQRLIVYKYAKIQDISASELGHAVRPVMAQDRLTLLYGLQDDDDDECYSASPITAVHMLLKQLFDRKLRLSSDTPQAEFEWWVGGAMQKCACTPLKEALRFAKGDVHVHLRSSADLRFVYGVCGAADPFDTLHHIMDAGQAPLEDLCDTEFQLAYGLSRRLCFEDAAPRARTTSDWWSAVYE